MKEEVIREEFKIGKLTRRWHDIEEAWIEYDEMSGAWRVCFKMEDDVICLGDYIDGSEAIKRLELYGGGSETWWHGQTIYADIWDYGVEVRFVGTRVFRRNHICQRKQLIEGRYDAVAADGGIYLIDCEWFEEIRKFEDPLDFAQFICDYCVARYRDWLEYKRR